MKGIATLSEIGYKYNSILNSRVLNQISKSLAYQSQFEIPQAAIDAIGLIQRQNDYMVGNVKTIAEALKFHLPNIPEINSLHSAFTGISKQITQLALQAQDWEIISDFEEITEQTLEFTENIDEELDEEQRIKFQILLSAVLSFFHKNKKHGVSALLIVDIFLRLAGIHQYCDFLKDKPLLAEKSEVKKVNVKQDSILYFIREINKQVKEKNEHRSIARVCEVKLKPTNKNNHIKKVTYKF
ncbi:hypothetical protein LPB248_06635 [Flavobacterium sp. LPB0248]|uniref:hypothetical protein n=1 Tax=Flavobacterium sp. LPB0248 TaxID=2614441 RepID=UPI0015A55517|nr:hypothetical protein [Flavobacterium sp. LPB0248]QLC65965.1 hypothetical protein LPB248_06635 [Flavobacterium sp. LPB0248]